MSRSSPAIVQSSKHAQHSPASNIVDHVIVESADDARVPVALIDPAEANPRQDLGGIEALAKSIDRFGLLQPLLLRRLGPRYQIVSGHRRFAAIQLLRKRHPDDPRYAAVAAAVRSADDTTSLLMLISSQIHIAAWSPQEEAAVLDRLTAEGYTLKRIGELLGRSEAWASRRVRVYSDDALSGFVQATDLAPTVAEELLPVHDTATRERFAERAVEESWNKATAKTEVRALLSPEAALRRTVRQLLKALVGVRPADVSDDVRRDLDAVRVRIEAVLPLARSAAA